MKKTIKPLRILLMFFIAASTWLCHAVDHSPRWIGNTVKYGPENSLNGLVDLDNFPVASYGYCKWGVLQDQDNHNTVTLDFTRLTAGPFANSTKALFLSRSTDFLQRLQFPADAEWNPANGSYQGGNVHFTQFPDLSITPGPSINVAMFRYLQFSPILFTTESNGNESQLRASTKKLIVLIHGWNPNSDFDSYGGNFASLDTRLRSQISGSDWKLLKYHWEADADTGPGFGFETVSPAEILKNGTESAEIAHQHGQHLGELLNETCPNLESVHLIAHSGASWAARAAAKFLLSRNPNLIVEVTLLDPFIPAAAAADSSLTRENMNAMALFQGNNRIFQLENYYSNDLLTGSGTRQIFDWRVSDVNLRVDWDNNLGVPSGPYSSHTGPIQFYSDTVASTVLGGTVPPDLADAPYYAANAEQLGWWRSLFWNEPIFDQQPQSQPVNAGQSATFTIHPNTRRARFDSAEAVGLTVQWQKDGVNLPGETFTTLTVANATAASAGEYVAVVSNPAGRRKSNPAILTVNGGSGAPTITLQPQDQTAEVGQTATFSVGATGNGSLSYQWKRNGAEISGATTASYTTSTVSLINDGYTYQVVVTDSQGFKASRIATLNVSAVTGSCSDPNEPNDSSLTATPLAFGAPTNGYICTATDVDWFRVLVTTNSLLTVTLNVPAGLDYDLEVYGPDALWRAGSYGAAGQDEVITTPVSPGNYYLRVYGFPAGSGDFSPSQPYQLSASTLVIPTSGTVSGTLTNSASWGGVVDITGDITIPAGTILNILPGTLVRCHAGSDSRSSGTDASRVEIILNGGTLNAVGTSGSPIVFTSDAVNKSSGDWYGIRLVSGSVSLSHFLIEFAVNGLQLEDNDIRFDSYLIEHGAIRNTRDYALYHTGSQGTVELNDLTVTNNSSGIYTVGPLLVRDSRFNRNTGSGISGGSYSLTLTNCDVSTNGSYGIQVSSKTLVVQNCTILANGSYGLNSYTGSTEVRNSQIQRNYGTGVYLYSPSPVTFVGNTVSQNGAQGLLLRFDNGGSESAEGITNNVIWNNDVGVQVYGYAPPVLNLSGNDIYQNLSFELRNDSGMPVTATNCYWGEPTSTELNQNQVNLSRIYDQRDNGSYGLVTVLNSRFSPISGGGGGGGTAPTITSHPQPQTVVAGTPASFTVAASGSTPFSYRWRKNNNPISGATNVTLLLLSVQAGDAGTYSVVVSNNAGFATSSGALLTVNPAPSNLATRTIATNGSAFSVSMIVSPWAGLGFGFVEETIPTGFIATGLNAGGTFNPSTGKILWGPMADNQTYQLNYTLQPPAGFQGSRQLTGTAYFFGSGTLVTGDSMVSIIPAGTPATLALTKMFGFWTVSITGELGRSYRLEARDDLNSGQWQPLVTLNITQNPRLYIDGDAAGKPQRFYRAVLVE